MAFVPGFSHDIFLSYAHGDDPGWVEAFAGRLKATLSRLLGVETHIWLDKDDLRKSRNFRKDIPESVMTSAVFLLLPSPTYIRSQYCVEEECRIFGESIMERRSRFPGPEFANQLFALRCPIVPVDNNEQRKLFDGLSDIFFCDELDTFAIGSAGFESSFRKLVDELLSLLKRMRNQSTPVFLYPRDPGPDLEEAHRLLIAELTAQRYRVLPDSLVDLPGQLRAAAMSIFLIGKDREDNAYELTSLAARLEKPWFVWSSPDALDGDLRQVGLSLQLEQLDSPAMVYLNSKVTPVKVKEEVLAALRPDSSSPVRGDAKPSVYLIWNGRERAEKGHAGQIILPYEKEFNFLNSEEDPARHNLRLTQADGVLLIWGTAEESWCSSEFEQMISKSPRGKPRGLCLFDPRAVKTEAVIQIKRNFEDVHVLEQFGPFNPAALETFFGVLRQSSRGAQRT